MPFTYYLIQVSEISCHSFVKCRLTNVLLLFKNIFLNLIIVWTYNTWVIFSLVYKVVVLLGPSLRYEET
jgi:hypothetical protein